MTRLSKAKLAPAVKPPIGRLMKSLFGTPNHPPTSWRSFTLALCEQDQEKATLASLSELAIV